MIPNLTLMIAAYIVFRCLESMAHEAKNDYGKRSILVFVAAIITIAITVICTVMTMSTGFGIEPQK